MQDKTVTETTAESTTGKETKAPRNSKSSAATAKTTTNAVGQANKPKCAYIYLGPMIPNGTLYKGSIFKGELPKHLEPTFEKLPEVKRLLVESREVLNFKKDLQTQGTEAYRLYQLVETRIREGALK